MSTQLLDAAKDVISDLELLISKQGPGPDRRLATLKAAIARESEGYNGWTNYETWNMNLWIENTEESYNTARRIVAESWRQRNIDPHGFIKSGVTTPERNAVRLLADRLKEWQEDEMPIDNKAIAGTVWADLLTAAFGEINWTELAETYIADLDKNEER